MKILHALRSRISLPPENYGGTERVIWALAQNQIKMGHEVRFLWGPAEKLPDETIQYRKHVSLAEQVGDWADFVHFHWAVTEEIKQPYCCTEHSNGGFKRQYSKNTVFLSKKHAQNHHANCYVYNGLEWSDYGQPNFDKSNNYFHFLGLVQSKHKNLKGSITLAKSVGVDLHVLGGNRFRLARKNSYFFPQKIATFHGMVGGEEKNSLIRNSKGFIFPIRWHEPFGLAIIESLYLGCPIFATPYGSLPELIPNESLGFLSTSKTELIEKIKGADSYDRRACHEYAKTEFTALKMTMNYMNCYEKVLAGETLNDMNPYADKSLKDILPDIK